MRVMPVALQMKVALLLSVTRKSSRYPGRAALKPPERNSSEGRHPKPRTQSRRGLKLTRVLIVIGGGL